VARDEWTVSSLFRLLLENVPASNGAGLSIDFEHGSLNRYQGLKVRSIRPRLKYWLSPIPLVDEKMMKGWADVLACPLVLQAK
jgi:hypothetical protein